MPSPLMLDSIGFSGQHHFSEALPAHTYQKGGVLSCFSTCQGNYLTLWLSPGASVPLSERQEPIHHTALFLAGIIAPPDPFLLLTECIAHAIQQEDYTDLLIGDYCGCLVTQNDIWFWKTRASTAIIFYRRSGERICWSTDPRTLVTAQDLSRDGIAQCCLGEDVFVYPEIAHVAAGTIVRCSATGTYTALFDQIPPFSQPSRITLPDLAVEARSALIEATRPLAESQQKIGILLSGGIDSAAVAAALVHHRADVTAYHLQFAHPAADESAYAQAVCQALSLPLVRIAATTGSDFLSFEGRFPHPYGHAGLRWMQLVAEHARRDGISLLTTGRGGDPVFGPLNFYGVADICSAPITASEKFAMVAGAISTDWLLPDIVKSLKRSHSLINERSLSSGAQEHAQAPSFLCQQSSSVRLQELYERTGFSPQDLVLETIIWQPHGLHMVHPYHHRAVQQVGRRIPAAYRLIPYRGVRVVKPVLRLAFADRLPPLILRQKRGGWFSVPGQDYCLTHIPELLDLLGDKQTQLRRLGILDPKPLREVLSSQQLTRQYAKELIATAMTELFVRQFVRDHPSRGA
jgi:asparagine synthase (glutamine-hydrolysing)